VTVAAAPVVVAAAPIAEATTQKRIPSLSSQHIRIPRKTAVRAGLLLGGAVVALGAGIFFMRAGVTPHASRPEQNFSKDAGASSQPAASRAETRPESGDAIQAESQTSARTEDSGKTLTARRDALLLPAKRGSGQEDPHLPSIRERILQSRFGDALYEAGRCRKDYAEQCYFLVGVEICRSRQSVFLTQLIAAVKNSRLPAPDTLLVKIEEECGAPLRPTPAGAKPAIEPAPAPAALASPPPAPANPPAAPAAAGTEAAAPSVVAATPPPAAPTQAPAESPARLAPKDPEPKPRHGSDDPFDPLKTAEDYVSQGEYQRALSLATQFGRQDPMRSWEIYGRAACGMNSADRANKALAQLQARNESARVQTLLGYCKQHRFLLVLGKLVPQVRSLPKLDDE
jgi:hypothetical protein